MRLKLTIITQLKRNLIIVCSEMSFSKSSYYIETSQMICKALQLTGFYVIRGLVKGVPNRL